MKSKTWFRLIFFPILLPLSIVYGFAALVKKWFSGINQVVLGSPVFSVGNFTVGGTGKTPVVKAVVESLLSFGKEPVLISKSYKADLRIPAEVFLDSKVTSVGDEALLLKKTFPELRVFSGPHKTKTALFASAKVIDPYKSVFVIDDGAQHHGVYKDFKIHIWDMSLHKIDIFPFPLGRAREFWFWGESPDLTILNRSKAPDRLSQEEVPKVLRAHYSVVKISSQNSEDLSENFVLISGLGNFSQLERAVSVFCADKAFKKIDSIEGRDHDSFDWFVAKANLNYVCTEKDFEKLRDKVSADRLFIVSSEFSENFKEGIARSIQSFFKRGEE